MSPIQQLIFSGDANNYELAKQLSASQGLDLQIFAQIEACVVEFNLLTQNNLLPAELFPRLSGKEQANLCYKSGDLSPNWAVFAPVIETFSLLQHQWEQIPAIISSWTGLKRLELRNGKLTTIAPWVYELPRLEKLILYNNHFDKVDKEIIKAQNLVELAITSVHKIQLCGEIAQLPQLKFLSFGGSNLLNEQPIPSVIFDCERLETLELKGQCFRQIPANVEKLYNLKHLSLEYCPISRFPRELLMLSKLESLELVFLPHSDKLLTQLTHFQRLKRLTFFSDDFSSLQQLPVAEWAFLEELNLYGFGFTHFGNQQQQQNQHVADWVKTQLPHTNVRIYC